MTATRQLLCVLAALATLACAVRCEARHGRENPCPLSSDDLFSPEWIGRMVTAEGVVHRAEKLEDGRMALYVYRTVAAFTVLVSDPEGMRPDDLVDALVSVRGRLKIRFGPDGVPAGVEVVARSSSSVAVLRPPPDDPYALPCVDVGKSRFSAGEGRKHRLHVKGVVTFSRGIDTSFMLHLEEGRNVCVVPTDPSQLPEVGDLVEACAFLAEVSVTPRLEDAVFKVVGHDIGAVPPPRRLSVDEVVALPFASDADAESLYAQTVETEGVIREVNRREKFMQVFICDKGETLLVLVPYDQSLPTPAGFAPGARLRALGNISFYRRGGLLLSDRPDPHQNLTLHVESVDDLSVLSRAPYWTARRVWFLVAALLLAFPGAVFALATAIRHFERSRYDAIRRERLRLSHDLHDNLQQLLAATMFRLDAAQSFFDSDPKSARSQLAWAKKAVEGTQAGLRSVLWDLREESEGPASLSGLLRYAIGRMPHWDGKVVVETSGSEPDSARAFGGRFLMIVKEAVGNALMRGFASHVRVRLFFRRGLVRLVISDNGCGFAVDDVPGEKDGHLGLASMAKRAAELGGVFVVKSEPGKGTSVIVEVQV